MIVLIKGAGDIASGIAAKLWRSGIDVVMTDLTDPTSIRRTVCFSEAIRNGVTTVEDIEAEKAEDIKDIERILKEKRIPVFADPGCTIAGKVNFDAVIDAILAKKNLGTSINDAPCVIAVGPGFTAGVDCHACVETKRGHFLGKVIYRGSCIPNTGIPGNIGGYTEERVLRSPADGVISTVKDIGDHVEEGETVAFVNEQPVVCRISGVLRGLLPDGTPVFKGMKSGDVDPRDDSSYCRTISDKASAVAGGVLEALLNLTGVIEHGK